MSVLVYSSLVAQSGERWFYNTDINNVAIGGYDVVSYFVENEAKHGLPEFSSQYKGITYLFSSVKNRDVFGKSPEKYLPQYGGWCSFFVGINSKKSGVPKSRVKPDPTKFLVKEGKL
ncbi:MAG: YHS domain-containing (seleno)protein, partial [Candidatus Kapaibacterium sp.]